MQNLLTPSWKALEHNYAVCRIYLSLCSERLWSLDNMIILPRTYATVPKFCCFHVKICSADVFILEFLKFLFPVCSLGMFSSKTKLCISHLQKIDRISRRRLWSLKRFYRDCRRLLSRLRHMRLSQGTLRRDLHGCSSPVIIYHHTFLILRGCHSPCHFSWWRRGHLRKGSSKNRKWLLTND